jgi:glycosyltransferase involved in cell wall biosynthesis
MSEIVSVTVGNSVHTLSLSSPKEELYNFCENLNDNQIISFSWVNTRLHSSQHLFFWLIRKLISKLQFNGKITLDFPENTDFSTLFFFPADSLGAIVSPVVNTTNQYGVKLGGIHYGGIAERAGLKIDDAIIEWDGQLLSNNDRPWKYFSGKQEGKINLTYQRGKQKTPICVPCAKPLGKNEVLSRIGDFLDLKLINEETFIKNKPNNSSSPLVSVLLHAYKPDWFAEALQSVLKQTYTNLEIIIGDDNTKGEIKAIVDQLAKDDPRIHYFLHDPPFRGWGSGNRYFCFNQASGTYIKYLCDDDVLLPQCIEKMVDVLDKHPEVSLVTSYRKVINECSERSKPIPATRRILHYDSIIDGIRATNIFHGFAYNAIGEPSTTMFRREQAAQNTFYVDTTGGVESESGIDDVSLWTALLAKGKLYYFCDPLSLFRITELQGSADNSLQIDGLNKWHRQTKLMYETGAMGISRDFRLHPTVFKPTSLDIDISKPVTGSKLQAYLFKTPSESINKKDHSNIQKRILELPTWPKLQLKYYQIKTGRTLPKQAHKGKKIATRIGTNVFVSSECPITFASALFEDIYYYYSTALEMPALLVLEIVLRNKVNLTDKKMMFSVNNSIWFPVPLQAHYCVVPVDNNNIDHLIEIVITDQEGTRYPIKVVNCRAILPIDEYT